ncbi:cutA1 divalent ion tolerance family protein [Wolbachia endosymbiont of Wuchereria bancrofti]|nr:cutA1 divalent ion tolerance family protein [Wolbachia endosymbiont of Wuchereria bancrofti]
MNSEEHRKVRSSSKLLRWLPWNKVSKAPEEATNVKYQVLPESDILAREIGKRTFYGIPVPAEGVDKTVAFNPNLFRNNSPNSLYGSPVLKEAKTVSEELLNKKLIICANIFPRVNSLYLWKGEINSSCEVIATEAIKLIKL